jgi:hypothetical protein
MKILKYLTDWKYRYFSKKLRGIQCTIEDLNFKKFKTAEIREEVRQTYDQQKAKLLSLETTIKNEREKPEGAGKMPEGDIARFDDEVVRLKQNIERYEAQLKGIDIDVNGSVPTNELPEGHDGINQQLDALRELEGMVRDYIKNL